MLWFIAVLYLVTAAGAVAVAIRSKDDPAHALMWVLICVLLPVLGVVLWWLLTLPSRTQPAVRPTLHWDAESGDPDGAAAKPATAMERALRNLTGRAPVPASIVLYYDGDRTYTDMLAAMASAQRTIDLEYYIFRADEIGRRVLALARQKAAAGVRVRLLVDGVGSRKLARRGLGGLAASGIECRVFAPVRFPWLKPSLNHRDHCKATLVDGQQVFTGGLNIGLEYTGRKPGVGRWRDTHLCMTGGGVQSLAETFETNWAQAVPVKGHPGFGKQRQALAGGQKTKRESLPHAARALRPALALEAGTLETAPGSTDWLEVTQRGRTDPGRSERLQTAVQIVGSGPGLSVRPAQVLYFLSLTEARRSIDMTTPYFAPDTDLTMAMVAAVLRGVHVRLLLPAESDHLFIGLAAQSYYRGLIRAGVEVYLYEAGLLHAKVIVVDRALSVLGAPNFDMRSLRLNYEVSQVFYGTDVAEELTRQFELDLARSRRLTPHEIPSGLHRFTVDAARLLAPLL